MTNVPPEFIYFDLGNVLVLFDHEIACQNVSQATGLSVDRVRQVVFSPDGLQWGYETGEITSRQFYEEFCRQTGAEISFEKLCHATSDIFKLNTPVVPIVTQLRAAGRRLGVLSNTCESHWDFLTDGRYTFLPGYFDVIALSYHLKSVKPEPEIYQRAAEMAGVSAGSIFYVDDRPENVAGAVESGYDAVLFESATQLARDLRARGVRFNY